MSEARSGPTVALRLLGRRMRARREKAGLTADAAAKAMGIYTQTLTRAETAQTVPKEKIVVGLMRVCGASESAIDRMLAELKEARKPGWWLPYRDILPPDCDLDLESAAASIRGYSPGIPPLLQTREYARALLRFHHPYEAPELVERRLDLLAARQEHTLGRRRGPVELWYIIEEAALTRRVGTRGVMRRQIEHLDRFVDRRTDRVALQVLLASSPPVLLARSGEVQIYRFNDPLLPDRLLGSGLHPDTVTRTDNTGGVNALTAYQEAMDNTAVVAESPQKPIPTVWFTNQKPLIQIRRPSSAGTWNALAGGQTHTAEEKESAERLGQRHPVVPAAARASRAALGRVVDGLVRRGVQQFLDLGAGLPAGPVPHQVAQALAPDARIVYVDNDPGVLANARALTRKATPNGVVDVIDADIRDVQRVLSEAGEVLDPRQPVAVLATSVLGHIEDPDEASALAQSYMAHMVPGSYLVTCDFVDSPEMREAAAEFARGGGPPVYLRTPEEVGASADGLELVSSVEPVSFWRRTGTPPEGAVHQWGFVAKTPHPAPASGPKPWPVVAGTW